MINLQRKILFYGVFFIFNLGWISTAIAAERTINLVIAYKTVNFTGKTVKAIAVNGQIPGPTLHFQEGDRVTINVYNHLDEGTALHWHGLLVPWQMDGVVGVSQQAIPPGGMFRYQFTLKQSGTYWYHAHAGMQEQQGAYGAFIIDPLRPSVYHYTKDYTVVLSDWSNTSPQQIYANLKKDGDFYSSKFPLQASLSHFIHDYYQADSQERAAIMDNYKMMQQMRMSIYDISDVAYDTFLLNGQVKTQPWTAPVKVGDIVRLRFIGAAAGTIFHVKIPGARMQMVQAQGNDIKPYWVDDFTIAPGETYDVLVKVQKNSPYLIYAEAANTSGAAYGVLIADSTQKINWQTITPFPAPGASMHEMMEDEKYQNMVSPVKTNDPNRPVQIINMVLYGYMGRFMWFINGLPEHAAKPILIEPGKRYRLIFINDTMMHHPMHLHGHFLILRNGHGAYDPLLHTIDVPPGATLVADFDADANGQWIFHCHFLYHMMAGMARTFKYTNLQASSPAENKLIANPMMDHPMGLYGANFLDVGTDPFNNLQKFTFKSLFGSDNNKLELYSDDAEINKGNIENADIDIFYWHPISEFWAVKGGINYFYRPAVTPYWQPGVGIEGLMPYYIDTDLRTYYHSGSAKFDMELSRDTQLTDSIFLRTSIRSILATDTVAADEIGSGLNQMRYTVRPYIRLNPNLALFTEYEHQTDYGVFENMMQKNGESTSENSLTFGVSVLF